MRRFFWIALLGASLASLGCVVPSLHPLFTDADLLFDRHLIGPWVDQDETVWMFQKSADRDYRLFVASSDELSLFDTHLLELGGHWFLDLFPSGDYAEDSFRSLHFVAAHTFYKLEREEKALRLVALNPDWLEEAIAQGHIDIPHTRVDGTLVLTAPTSELQDFVLSVADNPDAFPDESDSSLIVDLRRVES